MTKKPLVPKVIGFDGRSDHALLETVIFADQLLADDQKRYRDRDSNPLEVLLVPGAQQPLCLRTRQLWPTLGDSREATRRIGDCLEAIQRYTELQPVPGVTLIEAAQHNAMVRQEAFRAVAFGAQPYRLDDAEAERRLAGPLPPGFVAYATMFAEISVERLRHYIARRLAELEGYIHIYRADATASLVADDNQLVLVRGQDRFPLGPSIVAGGPETLSKVSRLTNAPVPILMGKVSRELPFARPTLNRVTHVLATEKKDRYRTRRIEDCPGLAPRTVEESLRFGGAAIAAAPQLSMRPDEIVTPFWVRQVAGGASPVSGFEIIGTPNVVFPAPSLGILLARSRDTGIILEDRWIKTWSKELMNSVSLSKSDAAVRISAPEALQTSCRECM